MAEFIDKKVFKVLMGLCLAMQVMALVPHHHHGENEAPCINIMHCVMAQCVHGSEAAADFHYDHKCSDAVGHSHGTKDGKCSIDDIDMLRVDREDVRPNLLTGNDILFYAVFLVGAEEDPCGHCYLDNILDISARLNTGVPSVHTDYMAVALPPRAPSFTV